MKRKWILAGMGGFVLVVALGFMLLMSGVGIYMILTA